MGWLIGVGRLELGDQDPEDVDEEAEVGEDAEEAWRHVDPLDPLLGLCGQRPAQLVVNVDAEDPVDHARNQG